MKVIILEDGKWRRVSHANLIKREPYRVLIEFLKYDYEKLEDSLVTEWFELFSGGEVPTYYHEDSNEFYSDAYQTEVFKNDLREWYGVEHANHLMGIE